MSPKRTQYTKDFNLNRDRFNRISDQVKEHIDNCDYKKAFELMQSGSIYYEKVLKSLEDFMVEEFDNPTPKD
jgi:hypothetical protein